MTVTISAAAQITYCCMLTSKNEVARYEIFIMKHNLRGDLGRLLGSEYATRLNSRAIINPQLIKAEVNVVTSIYENNSNISEESRGMFVGYIEV
ncbi:hypothetical protein [Pseudoalteromonas sp. GB56]